MANRATYFAPKFLGATVRKNADQNLPQLAWTAETYQTEVWDCGRAGIFGANSTRLTMVQTGYFLFVEHTHFIMGGSGWQRMDKNGDATRPVIVEQFRGEQIGANGQSRCLPAILQLTLADYIENLAVQDHPGGDDFIQAAADQYGDSFCAVVPIGI
jgi:hypothetical protein